MRIGIITYHRSHNYGALFQAFALKTFLQKDEHEVEFIDYWPEYHNEMYRSIPYFNYLTWKTKVKHIILLIIGFRRIYKRRRGCLDFMHNYLGLQFKPQITEKENLTALNYDLIIYGSDQIWRKQYFKSFVGFNDIYFGSCINAKIKISYAASMGVIEIQSPEDTEFLKRHFMNFDRISVREKELQTLVESATGKKPELVLDPVFLLSEEQWKTLLPKRKEKVKYVLLYQLLQSRDSILLAQKIADQYGYKVIEVCGKVSPLKFSARYKQTLSPLEFLSFLYNAEFVVTTSFHGAAFSIIFRKDFYALGMGNNSDRVLTLFENLDLSDRYIQNISDLNIKQSIDYERTLTKLQNQIIQSAKFLLTVFNKN
ncbi:MAG: polysaccharide pyruvyl transferase family protein [Clostridiaceae bacterium]|mgnify:CR=1 FL=1|nr:polysaccharide pyruvyl transferase family protein [Clostridiaceae bacterium]